MPILNNKLAAFIRLFLPALLLILLGSWFVTKSHNEQMLDKIRNQELLNVGLRSSVLLRHFQEITGDLRFLSQHYALQQIVSVPDAQEIYPLEANLASLLRTKDFYQKVRWIDAGGQEIIRVERQGAAVLSVAQDLLRNQRERAYFIEALKLPAGSVYISTFDPGFNAENGVATEQSVIRLAMPVADKNGVKRGIVIVNYLGETVLKHFVTDPRHNGSHIALLSSDGYWLYSPNPADTWGYLPNDRTRSLASRYPESWAKIKESGQQFIDANGLWTFESIYPLRHQPGDKPAPGASVGGSNYHWIVASHLTHEQLDQLLDHNDLAHIILPALLILIFGAVTFLLQRGREEKRDSDLRFRAIFDYAKLGVGTLGPDKRWLSVNPALARMLGYSTEELVHKSWDELAHADDLAAANKEFAAALRGKANGYSMEMRYLTKDQTVIYVIVSARAIHKNDGAIDFFVVVVEDVSNWILAEQEWAASVNTLQRFIDHLPGTAYVKDAESRVLLASKGFEQMLGMKTREIIGRCSEDLFPGEFGKKMRADDARILKSGHSEVIEESINGRIFESTKFPIFRPDGPVELGGITIDITNRRRAEAKLSEQIRRSAVLLELPQKAELLTEKEFMQFALDRAEELTSSVIGFMHFINEDGLSIELVAWSASTLEKYCTASYDNHYPVSEAGIWADAARDMRPVVINDYASAPNKHGLPDGHSTLIRLLSIPVLDGGRVRMITGVGNKTLDYSDYDVETVQLISNETWRIVCRQRIEKALRLATQVVNASPVVCFRWLAKDGWPVIFVSDNVQQWGYQASDLEAGNPNYSELVHPDDLLRVSNEVARHIASGVTAYEQEYRLLTKENQVIWVVDRTSLHRDENGEPDYFDGVLTDITERKIQQLRLGATLSEQKVLNKRLEEAHNQLLQSEKMASIGQLAAGVAHELNNPIGFVHSNLGTLNSYLQDLMSIIDSFEKAANDIPDVLSPQIASTLRLMEERDFAFVKEDIFNLLAESKEGLGRVRKIVQDLKSFSRVGEQQWQEADLHQGLDSTLNIVWNELKYKCKVIKEYGDLPAVHCLISQINQVFMNLLVNAGQAIEGLGTITIRTRLEGDDSVCIEISDTGKGIDPEHINRVFDPFFTTKPIGKGTGLGLSLSYSIIERHQGRIEVSSELGAGSTFRIVLPIHPKAENNTSEISS